MFLQYADVKSATAARDSLHGRVFNSKTVLATFFDLDRFEAGDYTLTKPADDISASLAGLTDYFASAGVPPPAGAASAQGISIPTAAEPQVPEHPASSPLYSV